MASLLDPVVLFFILGALAGIVKSDLRIPEAFYHTLSIYLLLSIGIKGGIELYHNDLANVWLPGLGTILLGVAVTLVAFIILFKIGRFDKMNAVSIAAHYGSVSAVTFAVVLSYLRDQNIPYEEYATVLLVMLEIPAIGLGIFMAKAASGNGKRMAIGPLLHEVFLGKTILLLIGGLFIGWVTAATNNEQLNFFFFDLFKGFLAIFMLEMGVVTAERFGDLKRVGLFLVVFGVAMPIIAAVMGLVTASLVGLSVGGAIVLATMSASASYIAAPAAMRIALPQANPTFSLTPALGITFPFNVILGIPLYRIMGEWYYALMP